MSILTPNYSLIKPSLTDVADITAFNANWDTIDGMLGIAKSFQTVDITSGADLNSFTDTKFYRCKTNAIASTLSNCPTTNAFSLIILPHTNGGVCQIITEYMTSGAKQYRRNLHNGTFGDWVTIATGDDLADLEERIDSATYDSDRQKITETYVKNIQVSGRNMTVTKGDGTKTTQQIQDTTYSVATPDAAGLMSAADKTKLDGIRSTKTIEVKTYYGTGRYGESNPNSLTFSFAPSYVLMISGYYSLGGGDAEPSSGFSKLTINMGTLTTNYENGTGFFAHMYAGGHATSTLRNCAKKSSDGKTLYWYANAGCAVDYHSVNAQCNILGQEYTVLAIA